MGATYVYSHHQVRSTNCTPTALSLSLDICFGFILLCFQKSELNISKSSYIKNSKEPQGPQPSQHTNLNLAKYVASISTLGCLCVVKVVLVSLLKCIIWLNIHSNLKLWWIENYDIEPKKKKNPHAHAKYVRYWRINQCIT